MIDCSVSSLEVAAPMQYSYRDTIHYMGDPKTLTPGPWTPLWTRSMDYLTDWSTDPFYGPPQNITEKENKWKYKQKWQKDLTYHLNGLTTLVGENSNVYFRKINRLGHKVILIAYFAGIKVINILELSPVTHGCHERQVVLFCREAWIEFMIANAGDWVEQNDRGETVRKLNFQSSKHTGLLWSFIHRHSEICN